jgi:hypothetical protein
MTDEMRGGERSRSVNPSSLVVAFVLALLGCSSSTTTQTAGRVVEVSPSIVSELYARVTVELENTLAPHEKTTRTARVDALDYRASPTDVTIDVSARCG